MKMRMIIDRKLYNMQDNKLMVKHSEDLLDRKKFQHF